MKICLVALIFSHEDFHSLEKIFYCIYWVCVVVIRSWSLYYFVRFCCNSLGVMRTTKMTIIETFSKYTWGYYLCIGKMANKATQFDNLVNPYFVWKSGKTPMSGTTPTRQVDRLSICQRSFSFFIYNFSTDIKIFTWQH